MHFSHLFRLPHPVRFKACHFTCSKLHIHVSYSSSAQIGTFLQHILKGGTKIVSLGIVHIALIYVNLCRSESYTQWCARFAKITKKCANTNHFLWLPLSHFAFALCFTLRSLLCWVFIYCGMVPTKNGLLWVASGPNNLEIICGDFLPTTICE